MVMMMPTGKAPAWRLRDIHWKLVFWFQDYGTLLVALTFVGLYIHQTLTGYPVQRSAMVYDATISQPHVKSRTLESWQAALTPIVFLQVTLCFTEFVLFKSINSITNALIAYLHFSMSSLSAWTTAVWVTAFFKNYAGRLRPDFFSRCKPLMEHGRKWDGVLTYAKFSNVTCTNPDTAKVTHGHFSFPSQHSTWAMVCAWYSVMYMSWTSYVRLGGLLQRHRFGHRHLWSRALREMLSYAGFMTVGLQIFFVWWIGVNRFRENRHNISDIVAGWFMGFIISSYFALRAMYTYGATRQAIIDAEARLHTTGHMFARGQSGPLSAEEIDAARGVREALLSQDGGEEQYPVPAATAARPEDPPCV